jgi:hypothetical protein
VAREIKVEKGLSPAAPSSESGGFVDCIAVSVSPELGERITLSAEKALIEEVNTLTHFVPTPSPAPCRSSIL